MIIIRIGVALLWLLTIFARLNLEITIDTFVICSFLSVIVFLIIENKKE